MRVYGRTYDPLTNAPTWREVDTAANGSNDYVYVTAMVQCIKLQLGESPFFADWGIPAKQSVLMQIAPDMYAALIQQRYAPHFASLIISRTDLAPTNLKQAPVPTYGVSVLLHNGTKFNVFVPV